MDGLNEVTWVTKLPTSSMEHHIDTFAVGMRIENIKQHMPDGTHLWVKGKEDLMVDDSALINERQLNRIDNDNCDTDVCSRCGSPEARDVAFSINVAETMEETVKLCNDCCVTKHEREFASFVTRDEEKIKEAQALGIKVETPRTVSGQGPTQTEWISIRVC